MIVLIEQIHDEGLTLNEPLGVEKLSETLAQGAGDTGFKAVRGSTFTAYLQKVGRGVLLKGKLDAEVVGPCKRCLVDVKVQVPVAFTLSLVPTPPSASGHGEGDDEGERKPSAGSFALADADEEPFDGKTIDLDPIVREQVLLALPMYVVCKDDCKGLCSVCGQNLNEKECGCERKMVDPRLAALKNIKLN